MYTDLAGKIAIVTGAAKGIGRGIAARFGEEKMKVVVNHLADTYDADELVETIKAAGGEAVAVKADISKESEVKQLMGKAVQIYGGLDVLVNNAGIQTTSVSHELSLEEWHAVMDVNLTGVFLVCREAIKYMLEQNIRGSIVNISSVHQKIPKPYHVHYASSKGGIKLLTETLALEYAEYGIRINAIAPGAIATPMNEAILSDPEQKETILSGIPMKKIGTPQQIASAAAWLVSKEADYITGVTLFVDGGMAL